MRKLKYIISSVIIVSSVISMQAINHVEQIGKYVFPENTPNAPNPYVYMPDGLSYLSIGRDNKTIIKYDTKTGKELEIVFDGDKSRENRLDQLDGFELSIDGSKMLIYRNKR